jgi:DNA mismatch endonuclease (patch repair protein)
MQEEKSTRCRMPVVGESDSGKIQTAQHIKVPRRELAMADVFTTRKRSEIMSRVKGRGNLATELFLVRLFREHGLVGWRRNARLFGKPDFVFPAYRVAVFVDGCFWHGCPLHGSVPKTNRAFWRAKLRRNIDRDRLVNRTLKTLGWKTLRLWQHDLRHRRRVVRRIQASLECASSPRRTID